MQEVKAKLPPPPVGIVFDSDMNRVGNVLALALLYGFDGRNQNRVISLSVSRPDLRAAAFTDAIRRFYSGGGFSRGLPIGFADGSRLSGATPPMITEPLARKTADGQPAYPNDVQQLTDTAEPHALIRNALTAQHDGNAIVFLAGPATNLVMALSLPGVKDLVARKVRFLSVMAGAYPDGGPELHIKEDVAAAKRLFVEWPTPIIAVGQEMASALPFPGASIETEFAWTPAHPVADAYRAHKPMPYDAEAPELAAALYAVQPDQGYFKLSDPGTITVLDNGQTSFAPSAGGKHRYLIPDEAQRDRILKTYAEVISAKPVVRRPRFPAQQQEEKKEVPKPAAKP